MINRLASIPIDYIMNQQHQSAEKQDKNVMRASERASECVHVLSSVDHHRRKRPTKACIKETG